MAKIHDLEERAGSVANAHKLIGVSRATWYRCRANPAGMPESIKRSIASHLALPEAAFDYVMCKRGVEK